MWIYKKSQNLNSFRLSTKFCSLLSLSRGSQRGRLKFHTKKSPGRTIDHETRTHSELLSNQHGRGFSFHLTALKYIPQKYRRYSSQIIILDPSSEKDTQPLLFDSSSATNFNNEKKRYNKSINKGHRNSIEKKVVKKNSKRQKMHSEDGLRSNQEIEKYPSRRKNNAIPLYGDIPLINRRYTSKVSNIQLLNSYEDCIKVLDELEGRKQWNDVLAIYFEMRKKNWTSWLGHKSALFAFCKTGNNASISCPSIGPT